MSVVNQTADDTEMNPLNLVDFQLHAENALLEELKRGGEDSIWRGELSSSALSTSDSRDRPDEN